MRDFADREKRQIERVTELIATASLEDLGFIASAVQDRREQLAKSAAYKAKRKVRKPKGHGQAIVERLFG